MTDDTTRQDLEGLGVAARKLVTDCEEEGHTFDCDVLERLKHITVRQLVSVYDSVERGQDIYTCVLEWFEEQKKPLNAASPLRNRVPSEVLRVIEESQNRIPGDEYKRLRRERELLENDHKQKSLQRHQRRQSRVRSVSSSCDPLVHEVQLLTYVRHQFYEIIKEKSETSDQPFYSIDDDYEWWKKPKYRKNYEKTRTKSGPSPWKAVLEESSIQTTDQEIEVRAEYYNSILWWQHERYRIDWENGHTRWNAANENDSEPGTPKTQLERSLYYTSGHWWTTEKWRLDYATRKQSSSALQKKEVFVSAKWQDRLSLQLFKENESSWREQYTDDDNIEIRSSWVANNLWMLEGDSYPDGMAWKLKNDSSTMSMSLSSSTSPFCTWTEQHRRAAFFTSLTECWYHSPLFIDDFFLDGLLWKASSRDSLTTVATEAELDIRRQWMLGNWWKQPACTYSYHKQADDNKVWQYKNNPCIAPWWTSKDVYNDFLKGTAKLVGSQQDLKILLKTEQKYLELAEATVLNSLCPLSQWDHELDIEATGVLWINSSCDANTGVRATNMELLQRIWFFLKYPSLPETQTSTLLSSEDLQVRVDWFDLQISPAEVKSRIDWFHDKEEQSSRISEEDLQLFLTRINQDTQPTDQQHSTLLALISPEQSFSFITILRALNLTNFYVPLTSDELIDHHEEELEKQIIEDITHKEEEALFLRDEVMSQTTESGSPSVMSTGAASF